MAGYGGDVTIRQLRIDELRHFYILPKDGSAFGTYEEALEGIKAFSEEEKSGYFRLRVDYKASLPSNFNQFVYEIIAANEDEVRYNPKTIWEGTPDGKANQDARPVFEVAELQQMTDPVTFIEKTHDQYPDLDLDMVRAAFEDVKAEMRRMKEEERASQKVKADKTAAKKAAKEKTDPRTEDKA
jgi:exonuclease SbcD